MALISPKQEHFLSVIRSIPGITTAELHRHVGEQYAHNHHAYTYETVGRMMRKGLVYACPPAKGFRGIGLKAA